MAMKWLRFEMAILSLALVASSLSAFASDGADLAPVICPSSGRVHIWIAAEAHHESPAAQHSRREALRKAEGEMFVFLEGAPIGSATPMTSPAPLLFPVEPDEVYWDTGAWIALQGLRELDSTSDNGPSIDERNAEVRALMTQYWLPAVIHRSALWSQLSRPRPDAASESLAQIVDDALSPVLEMNESQRIAWVLNRAEERELAVNAWMPLMEDWLQTANLNLQNQFPGKVWTWDQWNQDGRSWLFAKALAEKYCAAVEQKKDMWLEIGAAHRPRVQELLRRSLPASTLIEVLEVPDDSERIPEQLSSRDSE